MTKVFLERDGNRFTVSCKGHAKSEAGCAAVSILCYTLAGYLRNIECEIEEARLEDGDARICWHGDGEKARAAYDITAIGFMQLSLSYPEEACVFRQTIE